MKVHDMGRSEFLPPTQASAALTASSKPHARTTSSRMIAEMGSARGSTYLPGKGQASSHLLMSHAKQLRDRNGSTVDYHAPPH